MKRPPPELLVLYAHGSRDPRWRATFEELAAAAAAEAGTGAVRLAYLELSAPTIAEVIGDAARAGIVRLRVLPLFLAAGKHTSEDVLARVDEARVRHPALDIELLPPVGEDVRMRSLLRQIVGDALTSSVVHAS